MCTRCYHTEYEHNFTDILILPTVCVPLVLNITHSKWVWTNPQHDETTQATRDATRRHNLRHGDTICDTATRSATRPTRGATRTTRDATRATRNATRRHEMRHDDTRCDSTRKKGHCDKELQEEQNECLPIIGNNCGPLGLHQ